jgi:glycerol-3-phosphate dehydrogenase
MWNPNSRESIWENINQSWDVIVVGGGITGAGVLREAVNLGLKSLLLDDHDFSFGTSSRSSKLVHGGFRYLRNRQLDVTRESVREREWLLKTAPHLVDKLSFLIPEWRDSKTPAWQFSVGVVIYDLLAPKWEHRRLSPARLLALAPNLRRDGLTGGCQYYDAVVDDSCLVLRILREAVKHGAVALNYARVDGLLRDQLGNVCGVRVTDTSGKTQKELEIQSRVVINATGPFSDDLRAHVGAIPRLRKCRGSHLVFPTKKIPLKSAVTLMHPGDNRAMFAIPWHGTTIIGTTDIDHPMDWETVEPFATHDEIQYILAAIHHVFPTAEVTSDDIISTFAGLRPLIRPTTQTDPSAVSRRHVVWDESGLVTITGGKLTTFRIMARDALKAVLPRLTIKKPPDFKRAIFDPLPNIDSISEIDPLTLLYLNGRYGADTASLLAYAKSDELQPIENSPALWAELRWAARSGAVVHLEDLLLRRVRLGILLPRGGLDHIQRIRQIVQPELGWDDHHWDTEENAYRATWQRFYAPAPAGIDLASEFGIPTSNSYNQYSSITA